MNKCEDCPQRRFLKLELDLLAKLAQDQPVHHTAAFVELTGFRSRADLEEYATLLDECEHEHSVFADSPCKIFEKRWLIGKQAILETDE